MAANSAAATTGVTYMFPSPWTPSREIYAYGIHKRATLVSQKQYESEHCAVHVRQEVRPCDWSIAL